MAEASVANVFAVSEGSLSTPPPSDGALPGITRRAILELAAALSIPARERTLGRVDLFGADEVFLTGTGVGVVAVRSLDGQAIGDRSPGPITLCMANAFEKLARAEGAPV